MKPKGRGAPGKPRREPQASRPVDAIIIGAGVVGAAHAATLAREGVRVVVLSVPGRSTTAVSGGHLLSQSRRPLFHALPNGRVETDAAFRMARYGIELVADFAQGREEELGFVQRGSLVLAASADEEAWLREHFETLVRAEELEAESASHLGEPPEVPRTRWLTGDEARELEPEIGPEVVAATFAPQDAQVRPEALAGAWLQEAMAHGAVVRSGLAVESFIREDGQIVGVVAGGQEVYGRWVLLAAGPWSGELARMAGTEVDIRPRRGILLRANPERRLATRPLLGVDYLHSKLGADPCRTGFSFQQHPDGECVLGGSREFVDFSAADLEPCVAAIREGARRYLPTVDQIEWADRTVGFRPWSGLGRPYMGRAAPGLLLACGTEGDGVTLAAAMARWLVGMFNTRR